MSSLVSLGIACIVLRAPAAFASNTADPGTAVKDAYAELSSLLYAPPSNARSLEIEALISRNTDFDELTRRAFGEPCPRAPCTDHWAEFSSAQRAEVRPLFEAVVTLEWSRELARAFAYDIEIQRPVFRDRDARVRVKTRQKGSSDPSVGLDLFLTKAPPYKLVDLEAARSVFTRGQYKQFHRTLTSPNEGYAGLVARLKRKSERDAAAADAGGEVQEAEDAEPELDADAGPLDSGALDSSSEPIVDAPPKAAPSELPWGKILVGGLVTLVIGVGLGRWLRKDPEGPPRSKR